MPLATPPSANDPSVTSSANLADHRAVFDGALRLRVAYWILGAAFGLWQAWKFRWDLVNDTISYLDIGNYFFQGRHTAIVNGLWGPLYPLLLGLTVSVFKPSERWQFPLIHALLFFVFLFTMGCFDFFLRHLTLLRAGNRERGSVEPPWVWITVGYGVFLWATLMLIGVNETNPDMLIAAFVFLACGLLTKLPAETLVSLPSWRSVPRWPWRISPSRSCFRCLC